MSCDPLGLGCDEISTSAGGAVTNPLALNARDSASLYPSIGDVEPPDQGLCAGNGFVIEALNIGELRVFSDSSLSAVSGVVSLDNLMGLKSLHWSSGGDPSCLFDSNNGGHWFITEIVSTTPDRDDHVGPFEGCFVGVLDTCRQGIAVSATVDPFGAYNVYFLNPNKVNNDPGVGFLLNDFAKMGNTRDALLLFYDEFNLNPLTSPTCPAFGCFGFNGAQEFAINKNALEAGLPVSSSTFNAAYENMGADPRLYPIPANGLFQPSAASCIDGRFAGAVCWAADIPAQSPDSTQFDNNHGGSGFMVGALDFFGLGDNRMAVFDWTGLTNLNSIGCGTCGGISFGSQILRGLQIYRDEGFSCPASQGGFCGLAPQKTGPIPLGDNCAAFGLSTSTTCPEGGISTNGDFVTQVSSAQNQLWTAIPTLITQTFSGAASEIHAGAAYWVIGTNTFDSVGTFTVTDQAYVTAKHEDIEFPSIAGADSSGAVIAFTLSGDGGPTSADSGGFFPSTAFGTLTANSHGLLVKVIHIVDLGMSPQDGFTEYLGFPPTSNTRPRWGDYTQAIFDPGTGKVYFATEYIQHPNCGDSAFLSDPTCGGTRDTFANWGSSINSVSP